MSAVVSVLSAAALLAGAALTVLTAVGLLRLPDVSSRLQAVTKAQVLGLALIAVGVAPSIGATHALALSLVVLFQLTTAPVVAQMIGRAAHRDGLGRDRLVLDDLAQRSRGDGREPAP